jgi:hypothetical protein
MATTFTDDYNYAAAVASIPTRGIFNNKKSQAFGKCNHDLFWSMTVS